MNHMKNFAQYVLINVKPVKIKQINVQIVLQTENTIHQFVTAQMVIMKLKAKKNVENVLNNAKLVLNMLTIVLNVPMDTQFHQNVVHLHHHQNQSLLKKYQSVVLE